MKASIVIVVTVSANLAVFAQTTERPAAPTPSQQPAAEAQQQPAATPSPAPAQSVTLVGCVEREADYRRTHAAGRGGVGGTGAGVGNEFVLINASTSTPSTSPAGAAAPGAPPAADATVGTSGAAGAAYELTGPAEGQLEQYVGRRVELVGTMKSGPSGAADKAPAVTATVPESPTGRPGAPATGSAAGRPAGQPSGGIDIAGQDLKLREFEVVSVREAAGSCGPAK